MNTINDKRWQDWCDKFLAAPTAPMTQQVTLILLEMLLSDATRTEEREAHVASRLVSEAAPVQFRIFKAHADRIGLKVTTAVWGFVSSTQPTPGNIVMFVHALRRYSQLHDNKQLTLQDVAQAFPTGFPDETTLQGLWDAQKRSAEEIGTGWGDNYLDTVMGA